MNPAEVVVREPQRQSGPVVPPLLAMPVGKAGHAANTHADG